MDTTAGSWVVIALFLSIASLIVAAVAYWRSGGREDLEAVRAKQKLVADELGRSVRHALEESRTRGARAQQRLAELKREAQGGVLLAIDELSREIAAVNRETEELLQELRFEVTAGAQAGAEALARRIRRVDGSVRVLAARAEIRAAERLADSGDLIKAEDLLDDAVARVREAKMRLADDDGQERAFDPVINALHTAIHAIRERALDHKRQIGSVLSASDSLLTMLRTRETRLA